MRENRKLTCWNNLLKISFVVKPDMRIKKINYFIFEMNYNR